MDALELKAETRKVVKGHAKDLRKNGLVPAILYGKDVDSSPIQIEAGILDKVLSVAGTHQLISLIVGNQNPQLTLARDIQRDVIKRTYMHVDFYAVKMDEKVHAGVPLILVGESPAVTEKGGVLTQGLDEIEVECLPGDLIPSVEVNIEGLLELNDTITVSDLSLPDAVTVLSDPESMVVKIEPPRKAEELEAEEEGLGEVSAEPEVITEARDHDNE